MCNGHFVKAFMYPCAFQDRLGQDKEAIIKFQSSGAHWKILEELLTNSE